MDVSRGYSIQHRPQDGHWDLTSRGDVLHQGSAPVCAHPLQGWIWMRTQLDLEAAACWGVPVFGKAPGAFSNPPFVSTAEGLQLLGLQLLQVGTSTALLVPQGEGRVLWGREWEEKDGIKDS